MGTDVSNSNCWWERRVAEQQNGKGLVVEAGDFAHSLANPSDHAQRRRQHRCGRAFELKSGSDLINAGVVPGGTLPFDASYYQGNPDLGAVETP